MKTKLLFSLSVTLFVLTFSFAQNSNVQITVKWSANSFENKVEVFLFGKGSYLMRPCLLTS